MLSYKCDLIVSLSFFLFFFFSSGGYLEGAWSLSDEGGLWAVFLPVPLPAILGPLQCPKVYISWLPTHRSGLCRGGRLRLGQGSASTSPTCGQAHSGQEHVSQRKAGRRRLLIGETKARGGTRTHRKPHSPSGQNLGSKPTKAPKPFFPLQSIAGHQQTGTK